MSRSRKYLANAALALVLAASLAGCYAYPAGYQSYGYQSYGAYPAYGYGGYPYYGAYGGGIFIGGGDYGGYRHGYDHDDGRPHGGFNGRPGFGHAQSRPGGFGGGFHPGGGFGTHH